MPYACIDTWTGWRAARSSRGHCCQWPSKDVCFSHSSRACCSSRPSIAAWTSVHARESGCAAAGASRNVVARLRRSSCTAVGGATAHSAAPIYGRGRREHRWPAAVTFCWLVQRTLPGSRLVHAQPPWAARMSPSIPADGPSARDWPKPTHRCWQSTSSYLLCLQAVQLGVAPLLVASRVVVPHHRLPLRLGLPTQLRVTRAACTHSSTLSASQLLAQTTCSLAGPERHPSPIMLSTSGGARQDRHFPYASPPCALCTAQRKAGAVRAHTHTHTHMHTHTHTHARART
jgi:hypothetical protein